MKKYLILLFILIQGLIFSATKSLSDIKTLRFDVVEKTNIKSKKREISYKIDFILPNKIKKEVIAPELNKGEIYIYDYSQNKKVVYLPMFNEVKETQIVDDENRIIKAINKIIEEEYKKSFKGEIRTIAEIFNIILEISPNLNMIIEIIFKRIFSNEKLINKSLEYLQKNFNINFIE